MRNILKDKKGVFGLNAVQSFFAIILGIALLAYVIVIIMGTLNGTTILQSSSSTVVNETVTFPATNVAQTLAAASIDGASCGTITLAYANTSGGTLALSKLTQTGCSVINSTSMAAAGWGGNGTILVSYPYNYNSAYQRQLNQVLTNTSTGISGFFNSINPVYAILAVLVIILILVVLVRVVQAPNREARQPGL